MNVPTERLLAEHAASLLRLAQLYAAIGGEETFARLAVDWPYPGEIERSPDEVAEGVRRFHEQIRRASRCLSLVDSESGGMEG